MYFSLGFQFVLNCNSPKRHPGMFLEAVTIGEISATWLDKVRDGYFLTHKWIYVFFHLGSILPFGQYPKLKLS